MATRNRRGCGAVSQCVTNSQKAHIETAVAVGYPVEKDMPVCLRAMEHNVEENNDELVLDVAVGKLLAPMLAAGADR